jgi:hypothetical protein
LSPPVCGINIFKIREYIGYSVKPGYAPYLPLRPVIRLAVAYVLKGVSIKPNSQGGRSFQKHYGNRNYDDHHDGDHDETQFEV